MSSQPYLDPMFVLSFMQFLILLLTISVAKWVSNIYYVLRTPQNNNKHAVSGPVGEMEDTF